MNIENILKNLNQLPMMRDYKKELGSACDYQELPISPSMIEGDHTPVILNENATRDYQMMVEFSNGDFSTIEFPFVILGNRRSLENSGEEAIVLEKFVFCYNIESTLSSRKVDIDHQKLVDAMENSHYNVIAWGRVHGRLSEEEKSTSSISMLSPAYLEKYNIRADEFNIRVDELNEYAMVSDAVENQNFDKEVYQMTIMPTGEIAMLGVIEGEYKKFENVQVFTGEEINPVPVLEFDPKFSASMIKNKRGN